MTLRTQLLKFIFIAFIVILALRLAYGADNMFVKIYNYNRSFGDNVDHKEVEVAACTLNDGATGDVETTCAIKSSDFPCGKEGLYYAGTSSEKGLNKLNAQGAHCKSISGDYGVIYNCSLYIVDYDSNEQYCKRCFGDPDPIGVWDPDGDNKNGECCGDDPAGFNPDGISHNVDDPDMGNTSCKFCVSGLNPFKRDWSNYIREISHPDACCGDDQEDCMKLRDSNNYLCGDFGGKYITSTTECDPLDPDCEITEQVTYESGKWFWIPANFRPALIFNVSCSQVPVTSTFSEWVACENSSFGIGHKKFAGKTFNYNSNKILQIDGHDYLCYYQEAPKIGECCGGNYSNPDGHCNSTVKTSSGPKSFGGVRKKAGEQVEHNVSSGSIKSEAIYYCTSSYKWTTNLDIYDKYTCMAAKFNWTGHYCCSEADDREEFYTDKGGPGVCINKSFYRNNAILNYRGYKLDELYIFNGTLQGCAIDEKNAGGKPGYNDPNKPYNGSIKTKSNDFLLLFTNYPDSQDNSNIGSGRERLVTDNPYCSTVGPSNKYFCSYKEIWVDAQGKNRTHLSYINWTPSDSKTQRAECCEEWHCWDGNDCVDSFHVDAKKIVTTPDGRTIRCMFGNWVEQPVKFNWNKQYSGYCSLQSQCLVDPNGKYEHNGMPQYYKQEGDSNNPQCINNTQFIQDYYCDNGNWTTRTKLLVLQLLDFAGSDDYTLFCDSYDATLNYYKYELSDTGYTHPARGCSSLGSEEKEIYKVYLLGKQKGDRKTGCPTNCTAGVGANKIEVNCANNLCVLQTKGTNAKTIIGASLNQQINSPYYPFLDLLGQNTCDVHNDNKYNSCGGSDTVWYNSGLQTVIFSTQEIKIHTPNWLDVFIEKVKAWIDAMVSFFTNKKIIPSGDYSFVSNNPLMQRIYMEKNQNKMIFALMEQNVYYEGYPNKYLSATYQGFKTNICDSFAAYPGLDPNRPQSSLYKCELSGTDTYTIIAEGDSPVFNLWQDFTAKLRVKS